MKKLTTKLFVFVLLSLMCLSACQTSKVPVTSLSQKQSGQIAYQVPKGIDLTDIISNKPQTSENETIYGDLLMPKVKEGTKVPAVIIMHASGGVFPWREYRVAEELNKKNIAAFIPFSFEARGVSNVRQTAGTGISFGMRMVDAYAALNLLSTHPNIDKQKIGIMGYSSGAVVSMLAMDERVRKSLAKDSLSFVAHLNVYPSTEITYSLPIPTKASMLFLTGEKDDLCPMEKTISYSKKLQKAGATVSTITYPDAYHAFDSPTDVKLIGNIDNSSKCVFEIQENGLLVNQTTGKTISEKNWADNIESCAVKGGSFGRNSKAADKYLIDSLQFFSTLLLDK